MKNEINESVYDINMDKLCQNSIELIKYARNITAKQVNNVQIMTYYSETDLENRLLDNLQQFLLELGKGYRHGV